MRATVLTAAFGLLVIAGMAVGGKKELEPIGVGFGPSSPNLTESEVAKIKQLITDLGDNNWKTREKAARDLAALGERALPLMREALAATDDAELQQRLIVLIRKFDHERLVSPKRVTLKVTKRTARQIYEDIAKQTGYRIEFVDNRGFGGNGGDNEQHTFNFENVPFWQAVDTVAAAGGYTITTDYDDSVIRISGSDQISPYVSYNGPFRFVATNVSMSRGVQLSSISKRNGPPQPYESLNLSFQIMSEPKNPMLGVYPAQLTEATDNLGGSLLPPREPREGDYYRSGYMNGGSRTHNNYGSVNLVRGNKAATSIKVLKGKVGVLMLAGTVPDVVVTDVLKAKKKQFTGRVMAADFEGAEEDANQKGAYIVTLTVRNLAQTDPNRGENYVWTNNLYQRIELLDDKGNKYVAYGPQTSNFNNGAMQLTLMFGPNDRRTGMPIPTKLGPPAKLVINEWRTIVQEVPFEFKDVPLP